MRPGRVVLAEQSNDLVGVVLENRYHIRETIGVGGMGTVYLAEHVHLGELCAVKVLSPAFAYDQDWIDRFLLEARSATRIRQENVVQVKDFGYPAPGLVYMVMEAISGESLADLLTREGPLPWKRALRIADHVAAALEAAHACGIIHRDIKPSNCIRTSVLGDPDFIKVLDFGIAKLTPGSDDSYHAPQTAGGIWMGTAEYMAPEIFRGDPVDARLDIYSLGVLLFKLITGQTPFQGTHVQVAFELAKRDAFPPSKVAPDREIPPGVDALVLRALARDPDARTPTMTALRDELAAVFEAPEGVVEASAADGAAAPKSGAPESPIPTANPSASSSARPVTVDLSGARRRLTGLFAIVPDDPDPSASTTGHSVVEQARRNTTGRLPTFSSLAVESAQAAANASSRRATGRLPTFPLIPAVASPEPATPRPTAPPAASSAASVPVPSPVEQTGPGRSLASRLEAVLPTEASLRRLKKLDSKVVLAVSASVGLIAFLMMIWGTPASQGADSIAGAEAEVAEAELAEAEAIPTPEEPPPAAPGPQPIAEPVETVAAASDAPADGARAAIQPAAASRGKNQRSAVSEVLGNIERECRQRSGVRPGDSASFAIVISRKGTTRPNKVKANGSVFYDCVRRKLRATRFAGGNKRTIVRRTFTVE